MYDIIVDVDSLVTYIIQLAGYPASLEFPPSLQPSLTASLWYFLKLFNVFDDNV